MANPHKRAKAKKKAVVKKRVVRTRRTPPASAAYGVELEFNNETYRGLGETSFKALCAAVETVPRTVLKTRCVVRLYHGERSSDQLFFIMQLRRLLNSNSAREIWAKRLEVKLR